jgi:hypothetical protein
VLLADLGAAGGAQVIELVRRELILRHKRCVADQCQTASSPARDKKAAGAARCQIMQVPVKLPFEDASRACAGPAAGPIREIH